ncbi:DEAD/DEAH box helicase [Janibacter indicus]|uniref:Predicted helicase n=1 Tax=Janibacter indicus TaxID=857417 RepID=A0A1W1YS69_9MICO|nr:type ISP restriction/modification enzyme [Janibacter indicus]SMC38963.1 Predicted helicase [Janibacter indicus]
MSVTLEDLLDKIWFGAQNTVEKGSSFEHLIASYLRTAPEFADRFEDVYLWQDWPERGGQADHGIDIVAKDIHTGGWCAVQAKFYDPQSHINKTDIDTFLSAASNKAFTSKLFVSTTTSWGPTAKHVLDAAEVTRIGLSDLLESKVDWESIDWSSPLPEVLPTSGKKTPRPHQREALKQVRAGFTEHDRGQLLMACGTGKTFTSLKAAEEVATSRKGESTTVLFLVPSIQLLNQTLREWKQESEIPFRAFAVCSDVKVGRHSTSEDMSVHDLVVPATTDTTALASQIAARGEDDKFTVVFSTYQSIDVVAQAQAAGMPDFDLIICDEAHRTTGVTLADQDESPFVRVHDQGFIRGTKRLYMTATPRLFNPETKDKAKGADAVLASMDDEAVFGPVFHRLGFGEAVERDLLTDYKVLVLTVDEDYVARNFQTEMAAAGELPLGDAAKIIGCWNGLAKQFGDIDDDERALVGVQPMRRAVAFSHSIKASKSITNAFPDIVERHISAEPVASGVQPEEIEDALRVDVHHVDGTMNALQRGQELAWLKDGAPEDENTCRILSNARCLSEGVDVPALDAVLFLTPRGSQVDVVQSVGRVMRKAEGKKLGYIILPVVVPAGASPESALADNKRFQVVWQVLQALRAHDDRFNAMVNQIELNKKRPKGLGIGHVSDRPADDDADTQLELSFDIEGWRDAIYARIVKKVGERRYWETWAKDIAKIAQQHITRITALLADRDSNAAKEFDAFLEGLRGNLNDGITQTDAIEMLAQHLITRPVFEALFAGYDFAHSNPVAQTMERMLEVLDEHSLDDENAALEKFYDSVRARVEGIDNAEGRQRIIVELYDKFFATAFKRTVDKLGIVYTPVEIVDFILNSADELLRQHFGQGLTDEGVHILDGFTGTGTFMTRLLQSGLIEPHDLARKYANELHANEMLLLAYYIAAVNIETTYQDLRRGDLSDGQAEYEPFEGLVLTDTFQSYEDGDEDDLGVFPVNNERINRQRQLPITVIVGNPPYSSGQDSANDDNANEKYPALDAAIRDTYAARSTATNKNSLYDSYIRAIKWASLRIKDRGVIAYVTNGGWLDSNTADGMRLTLAQEFSDIYILNLRGDQKGDWQREGGKIFDQGSTTAVAVAILVKDPRPSSEAPNITFVDIGEFLDRGEKLDKVARAGTYSGLDSRKIVANEYGDWLSHRTSRFQSFLPLSGSGDEPGVFGRVGPGVQSNRDVWVYGSSALGLSNNMRTAVSAYQQSLHDGQRVLDTKRIKWSSSLEQRFVRGEQILASDETPFPAAYRPFERRLRYPDRRWIHRPGLGPWAFPTPRASNRCIAVAGVSSHAPFSVLMTGHEPNQHVIDTTQGFPRWRYEASADRGNQLAIEDVTRETVDGHQRIDNVTDEIWLYFVRAYGESFTKDDVFSYVYGLLHSPDYRETYAADLKKSLPRIPLVMDAGPFVEAGGKLSELHLSYESVAPYALNGLDTDPGPSDPYEFFRVEKMRFAKVLDPETNKKVADRSTIVYNDRITLSGIPEQAYRYMLGSRSAIEWVMDRYQVKTDKSSGIVNDPNDWSREVEDPRYIVDLLARIVTVSLETMKIVDALPALEIRDQQ